MRISDFPVRNMVLHRVKAGIDSSGDISGWQDTVVSKSIFKGTAGARNCKCYRREHGQAPAIAAARSEHAGVNLSPPWPPDSPFRLRVAEGSIERQLKRFTVSLSTRLHFQLVPLEHPHRFCLNFSAREMSDPRPQSRAMSLASQVRRISAARAGDQPKRRAFPAGKASAISPRVNAPRVSFQADLADEVEIQKTRGLERHPSALPPPRAKSFVLPVTFLQRIAASLEPLSKQLAPPLERSQ